MAAPAPPVRAPEVISNNMRDGRIGMRTGAGFLDYSGLDVDAYREQRLAALVDLLRHFGLARPPVLDRDTHPPLEGEGRRD